MIRKIQGQMLGVVHVKKKSRRLLASGTMKAKRSLVFLYYVVLFRS